MGDAAARGTNKPARPNWHAWLPPGVPELETVARPELLARVAARARRP